jgi:polyisoprenoid-binding protein YceI
MLRTLIAIALVPAVALSAGAADVKYPLDGENTKITFVGKKPNGKHDGGFKKLSGHATVTDGKIETLKVEVEIDVNSIYTDSDKLTGHLKNADFFDVANYPKATFKSTKVEKSDNGTYGIYGDLTMHGKTEAMSFPATVVADANGLTLSTTFPLDRTRWGMNYEKGVEKVVPLTISIKAKPAK